MNWLLDGRRGRSGSLPPGGVGLHVEIVATSPQPPPPPPQLSSRLPPRNEQVIAVACLASFFVSAGPLCAWWSRIRFSCPLDLVVRSFGLGVFTMFWVVIFLFRLASTGPIGRLLMAIFGSYSLVVVSLRLVFCSPTSTYLATFFSCPCRGGVRIFLSCTSLAEEISWFCTPAARITAVSLGGWLFHRGWFLPLTVLFSPRFHPLAIRCNGAPILPVRLRLLYVQI